MSCDRLVIDETPPHVRSCGYDLAPTGVPTAVRAEAERGAGPVCLQCHRAYIPADAALVARRVLEDRR